MALFRRKNKSADPDPADLSAVAATNNLSGRKLRSDSPADECLATFQTLCAELGGYSAFDTVSWSGDAADPPEIFVVASRSGSPGLYFAAWDRAGRTEAWVVPVVSRERDLPPMLIGQWKQHDGSLSSIGTVTSLPIRH